MAKELDRKVYEGDCLEIMPTLADKSIDLVVTSPPYDNLRTYNGNSAFDFEGIAKELFRVTKYGGVVVWVVGDATINGSETGTSFRQALYFKEIGFNLHDTMIYRKHNYTPLTHNRYEQEWEYMFCFSKGKPKTFNPIKTPCKYAGQRTWGNPTMYKDNSGELTQINGYVIGDTKIHGNIFSYQVGMAQTGKINHPAMFPEQLATDHILSWSNEGDIVLDPFAGSGTTGVACINTNRKFILIEKDPTYCEIIRKRIANTQPMLMVS
jgi:site-specific DNA-methyltransferase (adenine-specific)